MTPGICAEVGSLTPTPAVDENTIAAPRPRARRRADAVAVLILLVATGASRGWVMGAYAGEPDSALFPIGLWRWLHWGPQGAGIYDRQFSAGYYAFAALLARALHLHFPDFLPLLNAISLAAALLTAPLAYGLGRRFLAPAPAFWASLAWMLSPAMWWVGVESHPQGAAIALLLAAMLAWARGWQREPAHSGWLLAGLALLVGSLLLRCDGVFCFGFFFLLAARARPRAPRRPLRATAAALTLSGMLFWWLRGLLLSPTPGGVAATVPEPSAWRQIAGYFGGLSAAHQALPFFTAAGGAVFAAAVLGCWRGWRLRGRRWLWDWLLCWGLWGLPGAVFWVIVRGNNARHVIFYLLPLLWAGMAGWSVAAPGSPLASRSRGRRRLALVTVLALALDFFLWPASSNLTLYPSGNVPASARMLRQKEGVMAGAAATMLQRLGDGARLQCYYGSYTSPYVLLALLQQAGLDRGALGPGMLTVGTRTWVRMPPAAGTILFHDVYSASGYLAAARACPLAYSLEYDPRGGRIHLLGSEFTARLGSAAAAW